MSPRLGETRMWQRVALIAVILAPLMATALLAWTSYVRARDFEEYQQRLMRSSVDGVAGEIGIFIGELRRSARLFADGESARLQRLMRNPDDTVLYDALQESVKAHFPDAFAFTLADRHGQPYVTDFDGRVGDICIRDIRGFVNDRAHSGVYVHPAASGYHFDIMVDWRRGDNAAGVFFVSFSTDIIARILRHGELPGHQLLLLKQDVPGLIEITSAGSRVVLNREIKLSEDEVRRIGYATPVRSTLWNLVDLPQPGLFEEARGAIRRETLTLLAMVWVVSAAMLTLLYRYRRRNERLEFLYSHDAATGFPNRYFLLDRLQRRLYRGRRQDASCALLLIDLGGFRIASGALLHQRNNLSLMREAGGRIQATLSGSDLFAHLAGNEFAVLLPGADAAAAARVAGAVRDALKPPLTADNSVTLPNAAIGIAIAPEHGADAETLTQNATAALYSARLTSSRFAIFSKFSEESA